jgi:GT2 family glycosyltransferase
MDVELSCPLTTLEGLDGYTTLRGVVRLHGAPIGYINVPVINGRCLAHDLSQAVLTQQYPALVKQLLWERLGALPSRADWRMTDWLNVAPSYAPIALPSVTVAVCSRDRTDDLALCLEALMRLDVADVEILVVDNAPGDDATQELVRQRYPRVRCVVEPRPGLNWARRRAILEARGDVIAYTDDDVIVDAGWVRALAQVFAENPDVMAVTGLVIPWELETEAQILFERNGGFTYGLERKWYRVNREGGERAAARHGHVGQFGTGANMAYRRSVFSQIGLFDPALDVGTATNGGGDLEMFFRVLKAGHTLVYEPRAIVRHRHRRTYEQLHKQLTHDGMGFMACLTRCIQAYPEEGWAFARVVTWWFGWWIVRRALHSLLSPARFPLELIVTELRGALAGPGRYRQAQHTAAQIAQTFGPLALASEGTD